MNVMINHIKDCTKINQFLQNKNKNKNDQNQPYEQLNSTDKFSFTIRHKGRNVELLIESCRDDKKVKPCVVCSCDVYCLVSHSASSL